MLYCSRSAFFFCHRTIRFLEGLFVIKRLWKDKKIYRFIPAVVIMIIIFAFSAMPGDESSATSSRFLTPILNLVRDISHHEVSAVTRENIHWLIRKGAHFSEYAALGIAIMYALMQRFSRKISWALISELAAAVYAMTDELHQFFTDGRYMSFMDVGIDSAGAITGILLFLLIYNKRVRKGKINDETL